MPVVRPRISKDKLIGPMVDEAVSPGVHGPDLCVGGWSAVRLETKSKLSKASASSAGRPVPSAAARVGRDGSMADWIVWSAMWKPLVKVGEGRRAVAQLDARY